MRARDDMAYADGSGLVVTRAEVLLDTLQHEKYARSALLAAFLDDLRRIADDGAPDSTRDLLSRAEVGDLSDDEFSTLLGELRGAIRKDA